MELTPEDRAILEFECGWWTESGLKTDRIRTDLGISSSRYYKRLAELIDSPVAMQFDPLLIRRLRRRRGVDDAFRSPATGETDR